MKKATYATVPSCKDAMNQVIKPGDTVVHIQYTLHGCDTGLHLTKAKVLYIECTSPDISNPDYYRVALKKKNQSGPSRVYPDKLIKIKRSPL